MMQVRFSIETHADISDALLTTPSYKICERSIDNISKKYVFGPEFTKYNRKYYALEKSEKDVQNGRHLAVVFKHNLYKNILLCNCNIYLFLCFHSNLTVHV